MTKLLEIESDILGSTVKYDGQSIGTIRNMWKGKKKIWTHKFSDREFGSSQEAAADLHERVQKFIIFQEAEG